jgi:ferredoxin
MKVTADPTVCVGSGMCALHAPDVFDQSERDGTVVLRNPDPDAGQQDAVLEAVRLCPSGAIETLP